MNASHRCPDSCPSTLTALFSPRNFCVGLDGYFDPVVVSGDHGYRKPDRRLFQFALDGMGVAAENALYVGNDMHRDIFGAQEVGMTTVKFESDQGADVHLDCVPDYTITDFRDLLKILDLP